MDELNMLIRVRAALPHEENVDGLVVYRDKQAENNEKLGAAVRDYIGHRLDGKAWLSDLIIVINKILEAEK